MKKKIKIEKLFSEKKYEELISFVEKKVKENHRPPGLASLIGTCYFLKKKRVNSDLVLAMKYFEEAYLKDKNKSVHGLSAISNFMNVAAVSAKISSEFYLFLSKAEKFFFETEKYFGSNVNFLIAAKKLFWFQMDNTVLKNITRKLIENPRTPWIEKCGAIFFQNYIYNWSQEEYTKNTLINSKNLPQYQISEQKKILKKKDELIYLGFVSGDFTDKHSVFYFLKDTFKYLDRAKFKVILFSFNRKQNHIFFGQKEIKSVVDEFIDLEVFSNEQCINIIKNKKIDILFDIMGYSFPKRMPIFKHRTAPIQISWLATCNTVGLNNIDYLIADENLISEDEEKNYPEQIIKIKNIWSAHCGYSLERKQNKSPCETQSIFTFGSLNNFHKLSDETILAWSKILTECENSKLILKSSNFECNIEKIKEKFSKHGVADKIEILDKKNYPYKENHLSVYNNIDLALDPFPYNGVTTTFEALWKGVPVIVLRGFNFNSRCGSSIIKNSTYEELISKNTDEYVDKAVYFYKNRIEFLKLKNNLFNNILSTPLFDTKKFSENLAKSLISITENYK